MEDSPFMPPRSFSPMIMAETAKPRPTSNIGLLYQDTTERKKQKRRSNQAMGSLLAGAAISFGTALFAYYWGQTLLMIFTISLGCLLGGLIPLIQYGSKTGAEPPPDRSLPGSLEATENQLEHLHNLTIVLDSCENREEEVRKKTKTPKEIKHLRGKGLFPIKAKMRRSSYNRDLDNQDLQDDSSPRPLSRSLSRRSAKRKSL